MMVMMVKALCSLGSIITITSRLDGDDGDGYTHLPLKAAKLTSATLWFLSN